MKTFIVDSFTNEPFKGNPAGVCLVESHMSEDRMLSIAQELNFSETAFIVKQDELNGYSIRYFSPIMEIPLCGHATLAASKVLFHLDTVCNEINFVTGQNVPLVIGKSQDRIVMEFPVYELEPARVPPALLSAIGIPEVLNCSFNKETEIVLLEIESSKELAELKPDFAAMLAAHQGIHGVSVTARSNDDDFDFHSRFFWPWSGGEEDPVTGGTHTFLAKYWGERLGKNKLRSFQSSKRTGSMDVELADSGKLLITADAVLLLEGNWVAQ